MLFSCNPIGQLCLGGPGYGSRTVIVVNAQLFVEMTTFLLNSSKHRSSSFFPHSIFFFLSSLLLSFFVFLLCYVELYNLFSLISNYYYKTL